MALIDKWANRGEGIVTDGAKSRRIYRVGDSGDFIDWEETVTTLRTEYKGFTEAEAAAVVEANEQPTDPEDESINAWSMREENRSVGSYTIVVDNELKEIKQYDASPIPDVGSVSFSPTQNTNISSWPYSVQLSTDVPNADIHYRIDVYNGTIFELGQEQVVSGPTHTVSLNPFVTADGNFFLGNPYHKLVVLTSWAVAERLTGTVIGDYTQHFYGQRAPALSLPTFNRPRGLTLVNSWPQEVTATTSVPNAKVQYWVRQYDSDGDFGDLVTGQVSFSSSVNISVNPTETNAVKDDTTYHKYGYVFAKTHLTLDGVVYTSETTEAVRFAQEIPELNVPTFNLSTNYNITSWPRNVTISTSVPGGKVQYWVDQASADGELDRIDSGIISASSSVEVSVNPSNTFVQLVGIRYHKAAIVYARSYWIADGVEYFSNFATSLILAQPVPTMTLPSFNRSSNTNITSWPQNITASTNVSGAKVQYWVRQYNENGDLVDIVDGSISTSSSVNVSISPTEVYALRAGTRWHKYAFIFARSHLTLDGEVYVSDTTNAVAFAQQVPTVPAAVFSPAGKTNDNAPIQTGSFPLQVTVTGSGLQVDAYQRDGIQESSGFRRKGNWIYGGSVGGSPSTVTLSNTGIGWDERSVSGCPLGASYRSWKIVAKTQITLDGKNYVRIVERFYGNNTACYITVNPPWW